MNIFSREYINQAAQTIMILNISCSYTLMKTKK